MSLLVKGHRVIWKDSSETGMSDLDRAATLAFTELDLTAQTSPAAKFAILRMRIKANTVGAGNDSYIAVRKNGTTPAAHPWLGLDKAGTTVAVYRFQTFIIGLDSERKIQYKIDVGTGWQIDTRISVLGYIE